MTKIAAAKFGPRTRYVPVAAGIGDPGLTPRPLEAVVSAVPRGCSPPALDVSRGHVENWATER